MVRDDGLGEAMSRAAQDDRTAALEKRVAFLETALKDTIAQVTQVAQLAVELAKQTREARNG